MSMHNNVCRENIKIIENQSEWSLIAWHWIDCNHDIEQLKCISIEKKWLLPADVEILIKKTQTKRGVLDILFTGNVIFGFKGEFRFLFLSDVLFFPSMFFQMLNWSLWIDWLWSPDVCCFYNQW